MLLASRRGVAAITYPSASPCVLITALITLFIFVTAAVTRPQSPSTARLLAYSGENHWITTWTAASQRCRGAGWVPNAFYGDGVVFRNTTIRQTIRVTIGSDAFRIHLSNAFANEPLHIDQATIARAALEPVAGELTLAGSPGIDPTTLQVLTFAGLANTTIPPGGQALSDPVSLPVGNGETLSISLYLAKGQAGDVMTCHQTSRTHTWLGRGDQSSSPSLRRADAEFPVRWSFISAVETWTPSDHGTVVLLGHSITDSSRSPFNSNTRWSDHLFDRLQTSTEVGLTKLSIVNQAIGGNQLLDSGVGENLNARLDRDALAVNGIQFAVVVEGIIDIGAGRDHQSAYVQIRQIVARVHAANIPVFGATVPPFSCTTNQAPWKGSNVPSHEEQRLKLNDLIRREKPYDVLIDFDAILRDPNNATETAPALIGDDCLHPGEAGFDAMVRGFPIEAFDKSKNEVFTYAQPDKRQRSPVGHNRARLPSWSGVTALSAVHPDV